MKIFNSFRYGTISHTQSDLSIIENKLNVRPHWWCKKSTKSISELFDELFELSEIKLGYFPNNQYIQIFILKDLEELLRKQKYLYGKIVHLDTAAFSSLSRFTMYVRLDKLTRRVIKHEFAHLLLHVLVHKKKLSSDFHENVAQFVEK